MTTTINLKGYKPAGHLQAYNDGPMSDGGGMANLTEHDYLLLQKINQGKILFNIWGYSMTIVHFWEIIKETKKTVVIRQLKNIKDCTGFLSGTCSPSLEYETKKNWDENKLTYKEVRAYKREFKGEQSFIYIQGGVKHYLRIYDGAPRHYNHCD